MVLKTNEEISALNFVKCLKSYDHDGLSGKMSPEFCQVIKDKTSILLPIKWLNSGTKSVGECSTANILESPKHAVASSPLDVLEKEPVSKKYYLSPKCCQGIIRRAKGLNAKGESYPGRNKYDRLNPQYREVLKKVANGEGKPGGKFLGFVDVYNHVFGDELSQISQTVTASIGNGNAIGPKILETDGIRKLTPREAERLQGFSGKHTAILDAKDSERWAAIGNSMAVPVMRWIGQRIQAVEAGSN